MFYGYKQEIQKTSEGARKAWESRRAKAGGGAKPAAAADSASRGGLGSGDSTSPDTGPKGSGYKASDGLKKDKTGKMSSKSMPTAEANALANTLWKEFRQEGSAVYPRAKSIGLRHKDGSTTEVKIVGTGSKRHVTVEHEGPSASEKNLGDKLDAAAAKPAVSDAKPAPNPTEGFKKLHSNATYSGSLSKVMSSAKAQELANKVIAHFKKPGTVITPGGRNGYDMKHADGSVTTVQIHGHAGKQQVSVDEFAAPKAKAKKEDGDDFNIIFDIDDQENDMTQDQEQVQKDSAASIKAWATRRAKSKGSAPSAAPAAEAAPMTASAKAWAARSASGKAGGHGAHGIKGKTVHAAIFADEALKKAGFSHVADSLTGTKRGYSSGRDIRDIKEIHAKLTGAGFEHSTSADGKKQRYTHSGGTTINIRRGIGRFRAELAAADQRTKKSEDDQFEIDFDRAASLFEERSAAFGFTPQKRGIGQQTASDFGI